jgi:hypothetical protein
MKITNIDTCYWGLSLITPKIQILLVHEWALSVLHVYEEKYPNDKRLYNSLNLVFKWIIDPASIKRSQLAFASNESTCTNHGIGYAVSSVICKILTENTHYAAKTASYLVSNSFLDWQFIEDTFNHCYCPELKFDDNWKTSTVIELAKTIFNNNSLDLCPILADALEDAGCIETKVLDRLRNSAILRSEWIFWNLLDLGSKCFFYY